MLRYSCCSSATQALYKSQLKLQRTNAFTTVLFSWGFGNNGQLGHAKYEKNSTDIFGTSYVQDEPRKLLRSKKFKSVAIGDLYTLGVTHSNELFGWGEGYLQGSNSNEPVLISSELKAKYVSAGWKHSAIIDVDGQVHTWGNGGSWFDGGGQLGHGNVTSESHPKLITAFKNYGAKASMVGCGHQHTVILTDDGEVLTCGVGEYGLLGTGSTVDALAPVPLESLGKEDIVQIAVGYDHTLALTSQGTIYSWGRNNNGQLGHADSYIDIYSMENFPRLIDSDSVQGIENENDLREAGQWSNACPIFTQVAAGNARSAAITTDGLLFVWGSRFSFQPKLIPKRLFNGKRVVKVGCGGDSGRSVIAAITDDGTLWTLGDSSSKLLGLKGVSGKQPLPLQVAALGNKVHDISLGFGQHMVAFVEITDDS